MIWYRLSGASSLGLLIMVEHYQKRIGRQDIWEHSWLNYALAFRVTFEIRSMLRMLFKIVVDALRLCITLSINSSERWPNLFVSRILFDTSGLVNYFWLNLSRSESAPSSSPIYFALSPLRPPHILLQVAFSSIR